MDLAIRLLQWREHPPEQWARAANSYLPQVAGAVLVLGLAYQFAQLTWTLIPGSPPDAPPPVVSAPAATTPMVNVGGGIDVTQIIDDHLFGVASEAPVPVAADVLDAPDTSLSLQLKGTVSDPLDSEQGTAIIADGRGEEKTYTVADAIEGAGGAQLHSIYSDRVILNRAGRLETLRLPKELSSSNVTLTRRATPPMPAAAPDSLRNVLSENASRITDIIRVAPHIEQGQMVGFRINPGSEREQFDALGLQPGDVVTDINGTAMTDPTRGLQVFESLGESTMASVTVVRNGIPEVLSIDTSQLNQLAQDRQ